VAGGCGWQGWMATWGEAAGATMRPFRFASPSPLCSSLSPSLCSRYCFSYLQGTEEEMV
jgi:hypothetical protein